MSLKTRTQFQRTLRKVKQPHTGWTDVFPAVMGKADGTLQTGTPGEIYVRNSVNGQVVVVHNSGNVPSIANLQIEVGRRVDKPSLWQIKGQLENYNTPAGGEIIVGYHADQHRFPEADTVWVDRKQVTHFTVLVSDAENFIVQVYGGVAVTPHGVCLVENQTIDLSSYVPTSGAKYVSIVLETDGTLTVLDGTEFESRELATVTDIPLPAVDEYLLAFVLLYEFQESLSNDDIRLVQPFGVEIAVPEVLDDLIDVEVTGATDGQVLTFDSYSQTWIAADPTGGGASELDDLIDVEVPAPTDGQYLVYDAYSSTWFASDGPIPLIFDDLTSQVPDGSDHFDLSAEAPNGVLLFFNGILQPESEYTMDMDNLGLTTDFSPEAGDTLIAIHGAVGGGGGGSAGTLDVLGVQVFS